MIQGTCVNCDETIDLDRSNIYIKLEKKSCTGFKKAKNVDVPYLFFIINTVSLRENYTGQGILIPNV